MLLQRYKCIADIRFFGRSLYICTCCVEVTILRKLPFCYILLLCEKNRLTHQNYSNELYNDAKYRAPPLCLFDPLPSTVLTLIYQSPVMPHLSLTFLCISNLTTSSITAVGFGLKVVKALM